MFKVSKKSRLHGVADLGAWVLIVPAIVALYFIDRAMLLTLLQWLIYAPLMAGTAMIVTRIVFPQIELGKLADQAEVGNKAAAIVVVGFLAFVAMLMLVLVYWAKA